MNIIKIKNNPAVIEKKIALFLINKTKLILLVLYKSILFKLLSIYIFVIATTKTGNNNNIAVINTIQINNNSLL